jgi:hypothetical protein
MIRDGNIEFQLTQSMSHLFKIIFPYTGVTQEFTHNFLDDAKEEKMYFFVLLFTVLCSVRSDNIYDNFELLVNAKNQRNFTTNNAESVLDGGHAIMIGLENGTIYTQGDADAITLNSFNFLNCQFGLDVANAPIVLANGVRVLPGFGTYIPYQSGVNKLYRWLSGSNDESVFRKQNWYIADVGALFLMTTNGTFTGGVMAGTTFKNQSILAYAQYTYLKELKPGHSRTLNDIRIIRTVNQDPSYQVINEIGIAEQLLFESAMDEHGRTGYSTATVSVMHRPEPTGTLLQRNRAVLTFNYTDPEPITCAIPWVGSRWLLLQA